MKKVETNDEISTTKKVSGINAKEYGKLTKYWLIILLILAVFLYLWILINPDADSQKNNVLLNSAKTEMEKKFSVVKILDTPKKAKSFDVYGDSIKKDNWYVRVNKTGILLPIFPSYIDYTMTNQLGLGDLALFPLNWETVKKVETEIIISSGIYSNSIGILPTRAMILLLGKNEVYLSSKSSFKVK